MGIGTMEANGKKAVTPLKKANNLNEQVTSVFTKEDNNNWHSGKGAIPIHNNEKYHNLRFRLTTSIQRDETRNEKKASGPDMMSITF